jgi:RNA polymerase sigma-70 factor (ECF subfamily)
MLRRMEIEVEVERLWREGDFDQLATLVVTSYGPAILGFLVSLAGERADAGDAFSQACEDIWRGLPRFRGETSIKIWFYKLARHALSRLRRSPAVSRRATLSAISECAAQVRSQTEPYLRSEIKTGVAAIRAQLAEQDRVLLMLRIDRQMSWNQVAQIMSDDTESEQDLARAAAKLRQRFQTIKNSIRERARAMGIVDADSDVNGR